MADDFDRFVVATIDELASPKKRSAMLAGFAREQIAEQRREIDAQLARKGQPPRVSVDGARGAPLASVRPDGVIVAEFNTEASPVRWILRQLELESPRLTGAFEGSHTLFIDGVEHEVTSDDVPEAKREYVIASDLPYARKLEGDKSKGRAPASDQARNGVYQAVAAVARTRFRDEAAIRFEWRDIPLRAGGKETRQPCIVVSVQ